MSRGGVYFCEVASLLVVVYLGHLLMDFKNSFTVELTGAGVSGGVMRGEVGPSPLRAWGD